MIRLTGGPASPESPRFPFLPRLPGGPGGPAKINQNKSIRPIQSLAKQQQQRVFQISDKLTPRK